MSQHDYTIADQTGLLFLADLNSMAAAIVSNNSSATEPATIYAYQFWADTNSGLLKQRNAANNAWVTIGTMAEANLGLLGISGGATGAAEIPVGTTAQRPTGAAGLFRFNSTDETFEGYNGTEWGSIAGGGEVSKFTYEYIATAGQTTFSGADLNGQTLSYTAGNTLVTYGGLDLAFSDFTATNGTSIVLADGAIVGKIVRIIAFTTFAVADTYTQAQIDAKDAAVGVQGGVFYENPTTIATDYTITTNKNAMTAGPITVNSGVTVTVPTNSTWTIV